MYTGPGEPAAVTGELSVEAERGPSGDNRLGPLVGLIECPFDSNFDSTNFTAELERSLEFR
jgi:hypothetical protein